MNDELDAKLCHKYPGLFRYRTMRSDKSLINEGFLCGDGWYTLIDVISELLTKHNADTYAVQIKEKLGSLSFYNSDTSGYASGVEMTANTVSKYICEICGEPGILNSNAHGWRATLCDEHEPENLLTDNPDLDISEVADLKLGAAWSRLAVILKKSADWHTEKNGMPATTFFICISKDGQLHIEFVGGNEMTKGMVDLIAGYANRIYQDSGSPKDI